MAKFEALIDLTVEVDCAGMVVAEDLFYTEFTDKLLALAQDTYKIWVDVRQVEEVEVSN